MHNVNNDLYDRTLWDADRNDPEWERSPKDVTAEPDLDRNRRRSTCVKGWRCAERIRPKRSDF